LVLRTFLPRRAGRYARTIEELSRDPWEVAVGPNDQAVRDEDERRIVVGVDGSPCATRAVEFAVTQAARCGASLHVVSAYHDMPAEGGFVVPGGLIHESSEAIVSDATRLAEELEPTVVVKGDTVLGAPGPALARLSRGATALVVGTRGHSEVAGVFLGSVSQYVLHHATCNTIVVR
jgi:nucleotide-binding universal stress UspA family protein